MLSTIMPTTALQGILNQYFLLVQQGECALNEVLLVLIGRGSARQTSLVWWLVHDRFDPKEQETPGIALSYWLMRGWGLDDE
jgi:hypothetical protein